MRSEILLVLALAPWGACSEEVPLYCDKATLCRDSGHVCLLPEHECVPAVAWGELAGTQVVPPTPSDIEGAIKVAYNSDRTRLAYNLMLTPEQVGRVTAIHLHKGRLGDPPGPFTEGLPKDGKAIGTFNLTDDQILGVLDGEYHIDVHTDARVSEAEARAQITPLRRGSGTIRLSGVISALQERTPTASMGTGKVTFTLDQATGAMSYSLMLSGQTGTVTGIHVHRGSFPVEGPHIVDLPASNGPTAMGQVGEAEVYAQQKLIYALLIQDGMSYLNIHTSMFSSGELRAQLLPQRGGLGPAQPFVVLLKPVGAAPSTLTGAAFFILNEDGTRLSYRLSYSMIPNVTAARLVDQTGKVVQELLPRPQGIIEVGGTGPARSDLLTGKLMLVVNTAEYPMGAVSGPVIVPQ